LNTISAILGLSFLCIAHIFAQHLKLDGLPRNKVLSFAGGISVAYIIIQLLPELAYGQKIVFKDISTNNILYMCALSGLVIFYGVERYAKTSKKSERSSESESEHKSGLFWIHIGLFSFYNLIVGYLLQHEERNIKEFVLYIVAIALHLVVNDYGLADHYPKLYRRTGRWALTGSIIVGFGLSIFLDVHETAIFLSFAFIAGATILNVMKEELPEERDSNFPAFLVGSSLYLLLTLFF
jgi:hypothetical protein